ncbi:hypothetical protein J7F03_39750 [Streptomyces sp. ISL-43]|uniref:hypothetical protein n=1 Tax=Streptomyces sp. ISL-43 TaxID=2819183 RepID=UPI001BE96728|nr:hypothetical protein [Streptomyces sp. ISL-43]MBT2453056.1 hypothetical protein [Streptomyces sp. ISL-43]
MTDPVIEQPLPGEAAFARDDDTAAWSQAAQIIGLGLQLLNQREVIKAESEDAHVLEIPEIPDLWRSPQNAENHFPPVAVEQYLEHHLKMRLPFDWAARTGWAQPIASPYLSPDRWWEGEVGALTGEVMPRLYEQVLQGHDRASAAAALVSMGQLSRHRIVRVASAAIAAQLGPVLWWPTVEALAEGCIFGSETVEHMAADALFTIAPAHPVVTELLTAAEAEGDSDTSPAGTSITVHGTWSRIRKTPRPAWWRPGDKLFNYLKREPGTDEPCDTTLTAVGQDLYTRSDYYAWTGQYALESREKAAYELASWAAHHDVKRFKKVITHSHGGNVALSAAKYGMSADLIVLLCTPPHPRSGDDWGVISKRVGRLVSIRPKFDFVVLLDRCRTASTGQWVPREFPADRVANLKAAWFGHRVLTHPETWIKYSLAHEVAREFTAIPPPD